jgi:N-acetylneuraminic acid mutarotase
MLKSAQIVLAKIGSVKIGSCHLLVSVMAFALAVGASSARAQTTPAPEQSTPDQSTPEQSQPAQPQPDQSQLAQPQPEQPKPEQDQTTPAPDPTKPTGAAKPAPQEAKPAPDQAKPAPDQAKPGAKPSKASAQPAAPEVPQPRLPSLPVAVTGNAVAALRSHGTTLLFSLMGMGAKKTWDAVTNDAFYLDPDWDKWYPLKSVPGTAGRIDASAIAARGNLFLFGGIVVDQQNHGMVVHDVNTYSPSTQTWMRGSDVPVAVANFAIGAYRDRYIYLIGGRTNNNVVSNVQIYDAEKSQWFDGTSLPGEAVFGHAGAILDDIIIVVDGAYKNTAAAGPPYIPTDQCWMGKIDRHDFAKIEWTKLPPHPGSARFGIAAGASEKDRKIYFSGGTNNPDGDTGIGFDGKPAEPSTVTFAWNLRANKWEVVNDATPNPAMNNHGLVVMPDALALAGGLDKHQTATRRVSLLPLAAKTR